MTPARHNIVHVARTHHIRIDVECFSTGTLARFDNSDGQPQALMFDNRTSHDEIERRILACYGGSSRLPRKLTVRPENRASQASLAKLAALCGGDDGIYSELDAKAAGPIIHELSLTKGIELLLNPNGSVTWRKMGEDEANG